MHEVHLEPVGEQSIKTTNILTVKSHTIILNANITNNSENYAFRCDVQRQSMVRMTAWLGQRLANLDTYTPVKWYIMLVWLDPGNQDEEEYYYIHVLGSWLNSVIISNFISGRSIFLQNNRTLTVRFSISISPHNKRAVNQCWFNVGPPSTTLDQH